jgi:serine/threonine-protein kinase
MSDESTQGLPADGGSQDAIDLGLRAAFGPGPRGGGVLAALEASSGVGLRLLIRDEPGGESGLVAPGSPPALALRSEGGRYQVAGEIARGGIGVILRGRDTDLGREVALKILRDEHARNPAMVRRLVEEAQIGGQLQHPGVLPVYEIGLDPGERPFFTMKLIRGRTLAAALQERSDPDADRARFLRIFEQVCQTIAYAHARGVIHRDLKPSNILVGNFGEVQVADWGLAKVIAQGGLADEPCGSAWGSDEAIATVRTGEPGSWSEAGSVLGTPAYMPPEQARGEVAALDERCDVFALGAILCEILTGRPPYGGTRAEVIRQATEGRLAEAEARLHACGADPGLISLALRCLHPVRDERPRDANAVAREVTSHLASVEERAKRAELDAIEARGRARVGRLRLWLVSALAISLALCAVLAFLTLRSERARRSQLEDVLGVIMSLEGKARHLILEDLEQEGKDPERSLNLLRLTREAMERASSLAPNQDVRRRNQRLIEELRSREESLRNGMTSKDADRSDGGR